MSNWFSQIIIGIIVTVAGTLIANALMPKHGRIGGGVFHASGPARSGR